MYVPAAQAPGDGARRPFTDGFVKLKQCPYVGIPMISLSLGAPKETQYSAVQFCVEQFTMNRSASIHVGLSCGSICNYTKNEELHDTV